MRKIKMNNTKPGINIEFESFIGEKSHGATIAKKTIACKGDMLEAPW